MHRSGQELASAGVHQTTIFDLLYGNMYLEDKNSLFELALETLDALLCGLEVCLNLGGVLCKR